MKKIIIFLLTILFIGFNSIDVNAESFYEAEYIDNIYTKSVNGATANYQKARFFRRSSDNKEAYCIEPFATFQATTNYQQLNYGKNINTNTWHRMTLLAHYGYGYNNHTDPKWYAITQLMIWRLVEPNKDFYFTNTLNGARVEMYQDEMREINNLADNFDILPNINYRTINVVNSTVVLTDKNNVLNNYTIQDTKGNDIKIEDNKLIFKNIKEGETSIILTRKLENENSAALFYYNDNSQNLMTKGSIGEKRLEIIVEGTKNSVFITKLDSDNYSTTPRGEAKLIGAIYGLYDEKDNLLQELTINDLSSAKLENLSYGNYYLKEIKPGEGYTLNNEKVTFQINSNTKNIYITLTNKVIEKEVTIHKEYGEEGNTENEANINFDIFDSNGKLVKTITTDEFGNAKIILPYGKYTVKQQNTIEGYTKVDDFEININEDDDNDYYYKLYNYKIEIPDTGIMESNSFIMLFLLIIPSIYIIKKYGKLKTN